MIGKKLRKVFFLLMAFVIATFAVKHCPGSTEFCAANRYVV